MITNKTFEIKIAIDYFNNQGTLSSFDEQYSLNKIAEIMLPIVIKYGGYTITKGLGSYYHKEKGIVTHLNTFILTINTFSTEEGIPEEIEEIGKKLAEAFNQKEVLINIS